MSTNVVRGYNLNAEDLADLQLLAELDRRSVSFLLRDIIAAFLRTRRQELQQLKLQQEKVQP